MASDEDAAFEAALSELLPGNLIADAFRIIIRRIDRMCKTIERASAPPSAARAERIGSETTGYRTDVPPRFRELVRLDGMGWTLLGLDYEGRVWRGRPVPLQPYHQEEQWTWTLCPGSSYEPPSQEALDRAAAERSNPR